MATEQDISSGKEEIRELERRLEEKKRALAEAGVSFPAEKPVFREVLKEHIQEARARVAEESAGTALAPSRASDTDNTDNDDVEKLRGVLEEDVRALLEIALTRSIADAIRVAQRAGRPYLVDELHDRLIDDYYEKLLALRKI